jgi:hypothetical protein
VPVARTFRVIAGALVLVAFLGISPRTIAAPTDFSGKTVALLSSPTTSADCVYFTLNGVSVADPAVPGQPWFAVPRTHLGFKEIVSLLSTAKATDKPLTVRSSSQFACGYVVVDYVFLE